VPPGDTLGGDTATRAAHELLCLLLRWLQLQLRLEMLWVLQLRCWLQLLCFLPLLLQQQVLVGAP
jgi:hypothetical protein